MRRDVIKYLWQFVVCNDDYCSRRVQTTTPGATGHLSILPRKNSPETATVVFSNVGEDDTFGGHVYALNYDQYAGCMRCEVYVPSRMFQWQTEL